MATSASGQACRLAEAEVVQMGSKERQGLARVHFFSEPRAAEADTGNREWIPLGNLRPVPPEPPDGWLLRLQVYDIVEVVQGGCWVEAVYLETKLPQHDDDEVCV